MFIVLARLQTLDPALEQASYDLGAGQIKTFVKITLPQIASALLGAAVLGFTLSFDEIIVTFFLVGAEQTLPLYVYTQLRFGFTPEINAIFAFISATALLAIIIATRFISRPRRAYRPSDVKDISEETLATVGIK
jgi:ABC-type spermidine/putrescine transport system permease subunit II